ncbi:hypothetical protein IWZ00DRAFT_176736 [Phyllosticta capitalensis]|uniref:F-box domain-containing protein n=1 Tax=Phyllosticta capitalensis TaxID=121624 RepID=A0ABR1YY50_9PEZI
MHPKNRLSAFLTKRLDQMYLRQQYSKWLRAKFGLVLGNLKALAAKFQPRDRTDLSPQRDVPSLLEQLPVELLLEIDSHLYREQDSLSLRTTCTRMRSLPFRAHSFPPLVCAVRMLKARMFWDQTCHLVDTAIRMHGKRFCLLCREHHPKKYFSKDAYRADDPWRHICLGQERLYRFCEHRMVGYDTLRQLRSGRKVSCYFCAQAWMPYNSRMNDLSITRLGENFVHSSTMRLPDMVWTTKLPATRVPVAKVCPHIHLSNLDLERLRREQSNRPWRTPCGPATCSSSTPGTCPNASCAAHYTIWWEHGFEYGRNVSRSWLEVQRSFELGGPLGVNDPVWLENSEIDEPMPTSKEEWRDYWLGPARDCIVPFSSLLPGILAD